MIAPDLETAADFLRRLVDASRVVLPFTGAGISTECGIPDFRSPGGIWTKLQPIPFDAFRTSQEMRDESWRRRFAMEDQFGSARPGRGHLALASLYRAGKAQGVVTQNIDNLHQASGIAPAAAGGARVVGIGTVNTAAERRGTARHGRASRAPGFPQPGP